MAKTIMSVDDSASMRQMVKLTLSSAGYHVVEAVDGADAVKKLGGQKIDLFITDLNMPNMDGIEFIKQVRGNVQYKFTPVLLLTTESQPEKKAEGKAAGATGWIVKPFQPDQLLGVVKKVCP